MSVNVLFAATAKRWDEYRDPLRAALDEAGIDATVEIDMPPRQVDYIVYAPNMAREIILRGEPLKEKVAYTIFSPENVTITLNNDTSAATKEENAETSL